MPPRPALRALLASSRQASTSAAASTSSTPRPGPSPITLDPTSIPGSSTATTPGKAASTPVSEVASPELIEKALGGRIYTQRKTFLWNYYTYLIRRSDLILVFRHDNLSASEWSRLRRAIATIPPPSSPPSQPSGKSSGSATEKATLTVVRTGVLSSLSTSLQCPLAQHSDILSGQRALLTSPTLSPAYLSKVLATITRTLKQLKRDGTEKQPTLELVTGLLEGKKIYDKDQLGQVGKLPELSQLQSQLVGLLESQGRSLLGVLTQASGGALVRTLQGLEQDLKDKEGPSQSP